MNNPSPTTIRIAWASRGPVPSADSRKKDMTMAGMVKIALAIEIHPARVSCSLVSDTHPPLIPRFGRTFHQTSLLSISHPLVRFSQNFENAKIEKTIAVGRPNNNSAIGSPLCTSYGNRLFDRDCSAVRRHDRAFDGHFDPHSQEGPECLCNRLRMRDSGESVRE